MKYEFHVGDYVETKDNEVGYITETNSTYMPYIAYKLNDGETYYQTVGCQDDNIWRPRLMKIFNRIGQYDFTKKDEGKIEPLKKSWTLTDDVDGKGEYYFDSREVIKKINELVEAVNRLKEKVNGMA